MPPKRTRAEVATAMLVRAGAYLDGNRSLDPAVVRSLVERLLRERDRLRVLVDRLNTPDDTMREVYADHLRGHGYTVTAPSPQVGCNDQHGLGCECWRRDLPTGRALSSATPFAAPPSKARRSRRVMRAALGGNVEVCVTFTAEPKPEHLAMMRRYVELHAKAIADEPAPTPDVADPAEVELAMRAADSLPMCAGTEERTKR